MQKVVFPASAFSRSAANSVRRAPGHAHEYWRAQHDQVPCYVGYSVRRAYNNVEKHCAWAELRWFGILEAVYGLSWGPNIILHYRGSYLNLVSYMMGLTGPS
eukprot:2097990-Pleurochrysis_carterae.AAC.1